MVQEFDRLRASMVAVIEVPQEGDVEVRHPETEEAVNGTMRVQRMVEKPPADQAPSNIAAIGRYILTPQIFSILGGHRKGAGGEIQLTDAMSQLLHTQPIFAFKFQGVRFDCGDKAGFQMANLAFALERPEMRDSLQAFIRTLV